MIHRLISISPRKGAWPGGNQFSKRRVFRATPPYTKEGILRKSYNGNDLIPLVDINKYVVLSLLYLNNWMPWLSKQRHNKKDGQASSWSVVPSCSRVIDVESEIWVGVMSLESESGVQITGHSVYKLFNNSFDLRLSNTKSVGLFLSMSTLNNFFYRLRWFKTKGRTGLLWWKNATLVTQICRASQCTTGVAILWARIQSWSSPSQLPM